MTIFAHMIKAIVFDIGGVLIDLDKQKCIESFKNIGISCIEEMLDNCHQKGIINLLETGAISEDEFYAGCKALSSLSISDEDIRKSFLSFCIGTEDYKFKLLKELEKEYDLYLLSNNNPIVVREYKGELEKQGISLGGTFKDWFFSYQMKMAKPDIRFFEAALKRINLPAQEILFIDDNAANTDAAESLGMATLLYRPGSDLKAAIYLKLGR